MTDKPSVPAPGALLQLQPTSPDDPFAAIVDAERAVRFEYRITRELPDQVEEVLAVEGDGWIKLPLALARGAGGSIDPAGLELAIIAGFILRKHELHGYSPTLKGLQEVSGRGRARVLYAVKRLADMGVIRMRKVKVHDKAGQEHWPWRFEIPKGSLLDDCRAGVRDKGRPWVMLPEQVARFRSTIAASLAIIAEEIVRKDGALIGTPTMFGRMLGCSRSTANRLLKQIGAVKVGRSKDGSLVYQYRRPLRVEGRAGEMRVAGSWLPYDGDRDKETKRLQSILDVIYRSTPDGQETGVREAAAKVKAAGGTVATLARLLEETHLSLALRDPHTRKTIRRLLSWKMRRNFHRVPRAIRQQSRQATVQVLQRAASHCDQCDGMHHVEHPDGSYGACPTCRPLAAAPPD